MRGRVTGEWQRESVLLSPLYNSGSFPLCRSHWPTEYSSGQIDSILYSLHIERKSVLVYPVCT